MFGAYFDDSAMPGENRDLICMACYVAPAEKWDQFVPDWRAMLREYGIKSLHMTDLANKRGEFEGWSPEKEKRLIRHAHRLINTYTEIGADITVDVHSYDETMPVHLKEMFGGPYGFCAFWCMNYLIDHMRFGVGLNGLSYSLNRNLDTENKLKRSSETS
jgi:hypothetical protein